MTQHEPRLSILMPVYNGSRYLPSTIESLLRQTLSEFEIICINDCSTDNSLRIIQEYSAQDQRVRVISTDINQGIVPKVMNYAAPYVRGEYFVYTSQDDLFSTDWLQSMYEKAVATGADAVIPNVMMYHEDAPQKNHLAARIRDKNRVLTNREAVVLSLDWSITANALWASRLLREIGYYEFGMNADEYTARVYFFNCNKIVFSGGTFYYRQDNRGAITKKLSARTFDLPYTDFRLFEFLRDNAFPADVQDAVLLRSVFGLARMRAVLTSQQLKNIVLLSPARRRLIDGAEQRITKCFAALHNNDVISRVASMTGRRAQLAGKMLTNYSLFKVLSVVTSTAHSASGLLRRVRGRASSIRAAGIT